jgi:hypothetical protein
VVKNRVLRKTHRRKRQAVPGGRIKLHSAELHYFELLTKYYSGDQLKEDQMDRACGTYRGEERCIQELVGKPEGKRPLVKIQAQDKG